LHRPFPNNAFHDDTSDYSFSALWARRILRTKQGFDFPDGAQWFVSFHDESKISELLAALIKSPELFYEMRVRDVQLQETPTFGSSARFYAASPVLAKQFDGKTIRHRIYSDPEADAVLTQTLRTKLRRAGLPDDATVRFDRTYQGAKTKLVDIHGVKNRASLCPVIVEGAPEAVAFAWTVGVGHSTGAGFGALR
jgi:CRISPR-associated endoribonuclease Cas6